MQIERLKIFVDVAQFMSFTKAAEHSYISQSAVSQQIAALEKELGASLLLRDRKGNVSLTPEGKAFYNGCVEILHIYEKTLFHIRNVQKNQRETICLGLLSGSDCSWLPEVTQKLIEMCPEARVKPFYDTFVGLRRGLADGKYDAVCAIEYAVSGLLDITCETLVEVEPVLVVSQKHRLAGKKSVRSVELQEERFVTLGKEHAAESFRHWIEERQLEGLQLKYVETVESAEAQRMMVEMNAAVAILPILPRFENYDMAKCHTVKLEDTQERVRYVLAYRNESNGKIMRQFIPLIKEAYTQP